MYIKHHLTGDGASSEDVTMRLHSMNAVRASIKKHSFVNNFKTTNRSYFLVGVETNPGPTIRVGPAKIAKAIGTAVNTITGAKDVIDVVSNVVSPSQPHRAPARKKKKSNKISGASGGGRRGIVGEGIPLAMGYTSATRIGKLDHAISIPFEGMTVTIYQPAVTAAKSFPAGFTDGFNSNTRGIDLIPNTFEGHPMLLPYNFFELSKIFCLFRYKQLKVRYVPIVPTTWGGVISFGATSDPVDAVPQSLQAISCASVNVTCPIWQTTELDITKVAAGGLQPWYTTNGASFSATGGAQDTADRQASPGSIQAFVTSIADFTQNMTIGYLYVSGVIEFKSLTNRTQLGLTSIDKQPLVSNVSSPVDCSDSKVSEPSHKVTTEYVLIDPDARGIPLVEQHPLPNNDLVRQSALNVMGSVNTISYNPVKNCNVNSHQNLGPLR